jgi:hypothetical protein
MVCASCCASWHSHFAVRWLAVFFCYCIPRPNKKISAMLFLFFFVWIDSVEQPPNVESTRKKFETVSEIANQKHVGGFRMSKSIPCEIHSNADHMRRNLDTHLTEEKNQCQRVLRGGWVLVVAALCRPFFVPPPLVVVAHT